MSRQQFLEVKDKADSAHKDVKTGNREDGDGTFVFVHGSVFSMFRASRRACCLFLYITNFGASFRDLLGGILKNFLDRFAD